MPPDVHHSALFCKFFDAGYCRNGNNCRFKHDPQHLISVTGDTHWSGLSPNIVAMHEASYIPAQYHMHPYGYTPTTPNPVGFQPPFWTYESYLHYPQYSPSIQPSQYYPADWYIPQSDYISRTSSRDSSSVTSSIATVPDYPQYDAVQVETEANAQSHHSEPIVVSPDQYVDSALFRGSSGIANREPAYLGVTSPQIDQSEFHPLSQPRKISNEPKPYKTVRCKFYKPPKKLCPKGSDCTFIHSDPPPSTNGKDVSRESPLGREKDVNANTRKEPGPKARSPNHTLPAKPLSQFEAERQKGYFAVSWRVISGGVQMGVNKPDSGIKHNSDSNVVNLFPTATLQEIAPRDSPTMSGVQSFNPPKFDRPPRKRTLSSPSRSSPASAKLESDVSAAHITASRRFAASDDCAGWFSGRKSMN
ncbi:hypothetical protein C8R42DRAFT_718998 [Lentinula raphanica]|nr:hypothetical protein C8R42DRAFT_718998 [Lentinula raphanica]KAJ3828200.1 hypothetical protein F5880DRAFT_1608687 [Lentinula raphanica]